MVADARVDVENRPLSIAQEKNCVRVEHCLQIRGKAHGSGASDIKHVCKEKQILFCLLLFFHFFFFFLLYRAILCEIANKDTDHETESEKSELLHELSVRLDWAGISDPHNKVYIKPLKIVNVALIVFLFTASQLNKLFYCKNTGTYSRFTRVYIVYQDSPDESSFVYRTD